MSTGSGLIPLRYSYRWARGNFVEVKDFTELADKTSEWANRTHLNLGQLGLDIGGSSYQYNNTGVRTQSIPILTRLDRLEFGSSQVGVSNIGLDFSTTGVVKIVSANGEDLSVDNPLTVIINSTLNPGQIKIYQVTANVSIPLTGAHWGLDGGGDLADQYLFLLVVDEGTKPVFGIGLHNAHREVLAANFVTSPAAANSEDKVLVSESVGLDAAAADVGFFQADFDDTGNVNGENYWSIDTALPVRLMSPLSLELLHTDNEGTLETEGEFKVSGLLAAMANVGVGTDAPTSPNSRSRFLMIDASSVGAGALPGSSLKAGSNFSTGRIWETLLGGFSGTEASWNLAAGTASILFARAGYLFSFFGTNPSSPSGRSTIVEMDASAVGAGAMPGLSWKGGSNFATGRSWEAALGGLSGTEASWFLYSGGTTALNVRANGDIAINAGSSIILRGGLTAPTDYITSAGVGDLRVYSNSTESGRFNGTGLLLPDTDPPVANYMNRNSGVKAWATISSAGAVVAGYNVASATRTGTGDYTVTWNTDFAGTDVHAVVASSNDVADARCHPYGSLLAGTQRYLTFSAAGAASNQRFTTIAIGDQ